MNTEKQFVSWEQAVEWLRQQPDQAQLVRDCYYDNPLTASVERYWQSLEWQSIKPWLPESGGKALDVGAGRGIASYALAKQGFDVTSLEPDPSDMVGAGAIRGLASETGLPITVVENFSENLPFAEGEFDIIFARAVLHHSKDLEAACREFFRVLKPGGRLLAIREHVISDEKDLPRFLEIHPLHNLYGGEHAYLLNRYRSAISQSGFEHTQVIAPWYSAINFAPADLDSIKAELAERASFRLPGLRQLMHLILQIPGVWKLARFLLTGVDHRPGRLYSFIAEKR